MISTPIVNNVIDKEIMYRLKPQVDIDIIVECRKAIQELENVLHHITVQASQIRSKPVFSASPSLIPCYKGNDNYLINDNDIESVKSSTNTGIDLVMKDGEEYHTNKTLKELEEKTTLMRCHMQYLINTKCIKMIEKNGNGTGIIYTYSGETLPVSRRCMEKYRFN